MKIPCFCQRAGFGRPIVCVIVVVVLSVLPLDATAMFGSRNDATIKGPVMWTICTHMQPIQEQENAGRCLPAAIDNIASHEI